MNESAGPTDTHGSPHEAMVRELFSTPYYGVAAGHPARPDFAYYSTESGVPLLYRWYGSGRDPQLMTPGDDPVSGVAALHPKRPWLAFAKDADGDERFGLYVRDFELERLRPLTPALGRLWGLYWTRDEQLAVVGNDAQTVFVRRVSSDGSVQDLFTTDEQIITSEYEMVRDIVIAAVGRGAGSRLAIVDAVNGGVTKWVSESDDSEEKNPAAHPVAGLLAYTSDGAAEHQLVIVRTINTLSEVGRFEVPGEVGQMRWLSGTRLLASVTHEGQVVLRVLDIDEGTWSEPLSALSAGSLAVTADGPVWSGSGLGHLPGVYGLRDGAAVPLVGGGVADGGVTAESHWYESFDGQRIQGWLMRNPDPKAPLVVEVHGGPEWFSGNQWSPHKLALVRAGYHVFSPNFRGSTSFGNDFKRLILGDVGGADLEDVLYGARYATDRLGLDTKPAIMGGSYGGYSTLMALGTQPDAWAGGVAFVPPVDLRADYDLADAHFRQFAKHFIGGTPDDRPDFYRDRSPVTHTASIRKPVLILHGANDPRCPVEPVRQMAAEAERQGVPLSLHVNEDEGHGFLREDNAVADVVRALTHLDSLFA